MQTLTVSRMRAASSCPSPTEIWQILLTRLLQQHYGLTLNDTPFGLDGVIEQHIDAGISLINALNFIVEKYDLVRTDRPRFSLTAQSPFITRIDILRARKDCGLMRRSGYKTVTAVTTGQYRRGLKS